MRVLAVDVYEFQGVQVVNMVGLVSHKFAVIFFNSFFLILLLKIQYRFIF